MRKIEELCAAPTALSAWPGRRDGGMKILERTYRILRAPGTEWPIIATEKTDESYELMTYIAVLAAIPSVCALIGFCVIGVGVPGIGTVRQPVISGVLGAVFAFLVSFALVYLLAVLINLFAGRFGAIKDASAALKIAAFSYTPLWITGVFLLVPGLRFLTVFGLYGAYLLWRGLPLVMKTPEDKVASYTLTIIIGAVVLRALIGWAEMALFSLPYTI
jgi:hypothetical protein